MAEAAQLAAAGLTSQEAAQRLAQYGPNDPAPAKQRSIFSELLREFSNPLVLILLIAAVVSGAWRGGGRGHHRRHRPDERDAGFRADVPLASGD
jgi:hypothetical protein